METVLEDKERRERRPHVPEYPLEPMGVEASEGDCVVKFVVLFVDMSVEKREMEDAMGPVEKEVFYKQHQNELNGESGSCYSTEETLPERKKCGWSRKRVY